MDVIFCGTPQFAVPTLEKLLSERFSVRLVLTNPDEPSGRGYGQKPPPVKVVAQRHALEILQPARLSDALARERLVQLHPDVVVVAAYGHLIPQWMIDLPPLGCINLHASLLPKYRGAAPIPWAIIRGERVTGVTTMKIDAGLDTGDILLKRETEIQDDDTTETLSERLSVLGAELMVDTLRALGGGELNSIPQDHALATRAPMLKKEDGRIDWSQTAEAIWRRVRGLRPWPGAYTNFREGLLHLWSVEPARNPPATRLDPGGLLPEGGGLRVGCGEGTLLELKEVQLAGRKRLPARDFLNGVRLAPGERLG